MSEIMRPMRFERIVEWVLEEYEAKKSVFGLPEGKFYRNKSGKRITLFGDTKLASPLGPAAGPHSQLTQNIVTAYLSGGRFMELKTVQTMDGEELRKCVARPCINAEDEGYNVEWSTELTVQEAFDEYVKAWFILHVLMKELEISENCDFAFNMSVGYNLDGIKSEKIDSFIEGLKNAAGTDIWKECYGYLERNLNRFRRFNAEDLTAISAQIANSVTLSTLHGCPKEEIERITAYLMTEKNLHTYIKCNPTLLGYEFTRQKLDEMGYGYISFDEHHFQNDLQFSDAKNMFMRMLTLANHKNLQFGLKLTNTFPVQIKRNELPGEEMYMSGRALFPLTISLANMLVQELGSKLSISFAGGADYFNIEDILETGIQPVTVATTILKPGGYGRLYQLAQKSEQYMDENLNHIDAEKLKALAEGVANNEYHKKGLRAAENRKSADKLPLFDCATARCKSHGCPINQQIPEYLELVSKQNYSEAMKVIAIDNAAPSVTGAICNHKCQTSCTRVDYVRAVQIRSMKKLAVGNAADDFIAALKPSELRSDKKVVCIGGGPAGIAAALYLRRNGIAAEVFEKRRDMFGIVRYVIPEFRISKSDIQRDLALAAAVGVEFVPGVKEEYSLEQLKEQYDYIILATGAWEKGKCGLESGEDKLVDALEFLEKAKAENLQIDLGKEIAVIGGGDVAMDCARTAVRLWGNPLVSVVYRRTKEYMPAEREELELAEKEGVRFIELAAPVSYDGEELLVRMQELSDELDASGRRSIVPTEVQKSLKFDTVISAIGAKVKTVQFTENGIELNAKGYPLLNENNETNIKNVYVAGDCKAGPATVVKAMADAKKIAKDILRKENLEHDFIEYNIQNDLSMLYGRKGILDDAHEDFSEAGRCLVCDKVCELCCDVCPNRANMLLVNRQILHIDGMCNECGNCATFCPHSPGKPYRDKVTLFWNEEDFENSENVGFVRTAANKFKVRQENSEVVDYEAGGGNISPELRDMIENTPEYCY